MRKIAWFSIIIIFSVASYATDPTDSMKILERRQYYEKLFTFELIDESTFLELYEPLEDSMREHLQEAIQLDDLFIAYQVIDYLSWRVSPYALRGILPTPPKEYLDLIKNIAGLREFLFRNANASKPPVSTFAVITTLYGNEPSVVEYLAQKCTENVAYAAMIVRKLSTLGICTDSLTPLLINQLQNGSVYLASDVARYLTHCPALSTLPYLVNQLKKENEELDFTPLPIAEYFFRPDLQQEEESSKEPLVAPEDNMRMLLCQALHAYPVSELMPYKEEILDIQNHVDFGPQSRGTYEWLVSYLSGVLEPSVVTWETGILEEDGGEEE